MAESRHTYNPLPETSGPDPTLENELSDTSPSTIVDVVDLLKCRPWVHCGAKVIIVAYWTIMATVFIAALCALYVGNSNHPTLSRFFEEQVSCHDGIPVSWKVVASLCLVVFVAFELYAASQTKMGSAMIHTKKLSVLLALGFGVLARYDAFTDLVFALIAESCGSTIGYWSFVIFAVGVLFVQGVPALWFMGSDRLGTHLGLKSNDLCLLLELIDPCRGELELPLEMEAAMTENSKKEEIDKLLIARTDVDTDPANGSSGTRTRTQSEVDVIKQQIEELTNFEAERESDDPDTVKNAALVARAKKLAGGARFLFEDLLQGIAQVSFLFENFDTITWWTKIFTISSVLAGLTVSCGGPLYALWKERKNEQYYAKLPKPRNGATWKGVVRGEGQVSGHTWVDWSQMTLKCSHLERLSGQSNMTVSGEVQWKGLLREIDGKWESSEDTPAWAVKYLSGQDDLSEEVVEGTYEPKSAMLLLQTTKQDVIRNEGGANYAFYKYKLKMFPDKLKGEYHHVSGNEYASILTLKLVS